MRNMFKKTILSFAVSVALATGASAAVDMNTDKASYKQSFNLPLDFFFSYAYKNHKGFSFTGGYTTSDVEKSGEMFTKFSNNHRSEILSNAELILDMGGRGENGYAAMMQVKNVSKSDGWRVLEETLSKPLIQVRAGDIYGGKIEIEQKNTGNGVLVAMSYSFKNSNFLINFNFEEDNFFKGMVYISDVTINEVSLPIYTQNQKKESTLKDVSNEFIKSQILETFNEVGTFNNPYFVDNFIQIVSGQDAEFEKILKEKLKKAGGAK